MKHINAKLYYSIFLAGFIFLSSCQSTRHSTRTTYKVVQAKGYRISMDSTFDKNLDEKAINILQPYKEKVNKQMNEVLGYAEMKMERSRPEALLSNLVADVLKNAATKYTGRPADVSLINIGGLRNILPQGNITIGHIFEILPFDNSLCIVTLKGSVLKTLFSEIAKAGGEGISGAHLIITTNGRLEAATVNNKQIDDTKLYTVSTIDYLAEGNGGMLALTENEGKICPDGETLRKLFIDFLKAQTAAGKHITAKIEGRIIVR